MKNLRYKLFTYGFIFLAGGLFSCQNNSESKKETAKIQVEEITQYEGYELVWNDEFSYEGLPDSTKWAYDTEGNEAGWGNNEAQYYTDSRLENASVSDGKLHVTVQHEQFEGKEYTSARLMTKQAWKHGKFEMSAKLPDARGSWCAFWMMPEGWSFNDGGWPNVGELDIVEHLGHDKGVIHASAHSKNHQWWEGTEVTTTAKVDSITEKFHKYTFEWDETEVKAFVDDKQFFSYKNEGEGMDSWPYVKPFYMLLNVAVGGEWGEKYGIDDAAFPQSMVVDYVRVYKKK